MVRHVLLNLISHLIIISWAQKKYFNLVLVAISHGWFFIHCGRYVYIEVYAHKCIWLIAETAREMLYMHSLYVSALRPWEYADTSTSHKLGCKARSCFDWPSLMLVSVQWVLATMIHAYYNGRYTFLDALFLCTNSCTLFQLKPPCSLALFLAVVCLTMKRPAFASCIPGSGCFRRSLQ